MHVNFGVVPVIEDATDLNIVEDEDLHNIISEARDEFKSFTPPMPTLPCTYRNVLMPRGNRPQLRIR